MNSRNRTIRREVGVFMLSLPFLCLNLGYALTYSAPQPKTISLGSLPSVVTDGFDYPVGKPDGIGWLNNHSGLGFLDPYNYGPKCGWVKHPGNDFNKDGTQGDQDRYQPVYAVANGVVVASGGWFDSTWGNIILIEHTLPDNTKVWSQYGHLEERKYQTGEEVKAGQTVTRGQQIGKVGKGDGSLPAHLHFEIRKNGPSKFTAHYFPCGQSAAYVQSLYYNPIDFINSHRSSGNVSGNDFSISVGPFQQVVAPNSTINYSVLTSTVSGGLQPITLSLDGLPSNASYSFSPPVVTSGQTSTLVIQVPASVQLGNFPLTITGRGQTTQFERTTLIVRGAPTANIALSSGVKTASNNGTLNLTVTQGSTAHVTLNGSKTNSGGSSGVSFVWLLQPASPPKANGISSNAAPIQSNLPAFETDMGPGSYNVTLQATNNEGLKDTAVGTILIDSTPASPPSISSIAPVSVAPSVFSLTINGTGFDSGAIDQIYFGSTLVGNGSIVSRSGTQIVVQESMSTATLGTYTVKVKNSDGQLSNTVPLVLTQTQTPAPSISSISPASVAPGLFDLMINGSNFDGTAIDQVFFGSSFVGSGQILNRTGSTQIVVRESMSTATLGTYTVKVKNSDGQMSNGVGLTLTQANGPAPAITSMNPNPVPGAAANQTVGVFGSNFVNGSGLKVRVTYPGGTTDLQGAQVSYVSSAQLNILITVGTSGANWTAQVLNPDGQGSNVFSFSVTGASGPQISSVSPNPMTGSSSPQTLTINGSAFSSSSTVTLRSPFQTYVNLPTTSITASQIVMQVTIGTTAAQWTAEVIDHGLSSGQFAFQVVAPAAPQIASMNPNPVPGSSADQAVSIVGSGFISGSGLKVRVTFPGGQTDLQGGQVSFISATQLNILINVGTGAANWTAQVINPDGTRSNIFAFSVTASPGPHITSVSPNPMMGSNNPQTLTINGSGFTSSSTVTLRSPSQTYTNLPTTSIAAAEIVMQVTIGTTAAQWTAEVIDHGVSSSQFAFQVVAPGAPAINSMNPNPVPGSSSDQTVSIFGANFVSGSSLKVHVTYPNGATDLQGSQVTWISATQLNILINVGTGAANWTAQVINPDGQGSNVFSFSVTAAPGPHITSVSPNPMTGSNSPQTLTINGSGFTSSSTVTLRSPSQTYSNLPTTSIAATQIVMQVTIGTTAAQWTAEVIDHGVSSGQFAFQVLAPTAPHINSVSPNPMTGTNNPQTLTINGSGFTSSSTVTLRSPFQTYTNLPTTSITASQIVMQVTIGTTAAQWTVEVIDQGQSSGQFTFQVVAPAPHIDSMNPNPVPGSSVDQTVSISGSNFVSGSGLKVRVTFPGGQTDLQGGQVSFISAAQINILINVGTGAANWTAQVLNPDGTGSNVFSFSVTAAPGPHINSVSPNPMTGSNNPQTLTINGTGFTSSSTVTLRSPFQTYTNLPTTSISLTQIVMQVTLGTTAAQWTVEVIDHGVSSGQFAFQVVAPPTPHINSVSPNPVTGSNSSQTFTINGSAFTSNSTVTLRSPFQTYPNQPTNSITASQIILPVTFGTTAAQWTVEVIDQGQSSGQFAFQVVAPPGPSISGISPNPVPTFNANQNVQVSGSNFQSGLTVDVFNSGGSKISTLSGSQILNVGASSFTMVVNLGSTASSFGIEVVNPDSTRSSRFTFSTTASNPSVSSISPNPVPVFNGNQSVQVSGSSFQSGLTVDVFNSSGTKVGTLSGSGQIQSVAPTSFTMVINLGGSSGTFGIEVVNPNGGRSTRFTFSY